MADATTSLKPLPRAAGSANGSPVSVQACRNRPSRADRIVAFNARSDAELAGIGQSRDGIVAHVLRDTFYIQARASR